MTSVLAKGDPETAVRMFDTNRALSRGVMDVPKPAITHNIAERPTAMAPTTATTRARIAAVPMTAGTSSDLIWHNPSSGQTVSWAMSGLTSSASTTLLQLPNWKVTRSLDLNGDGQQDLIWTNSSTSEIVAWIMNGAQAVQSSTLLQAPGWQLTHAADFDGNGKDDLIFFNPGTGQTVMWLMNGTSVQSSQVIFTSTAWQVVHAADLNGDGKADLIWRNTATGQTATWLMNGTTILANALLLDLPVWQITHVGDLDGDGRDDLIWHHAASGQTVAWLMNGLSITGSTTLFAHAEWRITHVGDLDGDRRADLIWQRTRTGEVAAWLMNGLGVKSSAGLLSSRDWQLSQLTDLNGDGSQDLIWRSPSTNQTVGWLMSGLTPQSQGVLLALGGWEISATRRSAAPSAPPAVSPGTLSGLVVASAPVSGATVNAFKLVVGNAIGDYLSESNTPPVATTTTAADGSYRLSLASHTGPLLIAAKGGRYFDGLKGASVALDSSLRAVVSNFTAGRTLHVTPLTDTLVSASETTGGGSYYVLIKVYDRIEQNAPAQLGFDPLTVRPLQPNLATALPQERTHGAYVAFFAALKTGGQSWRQITQSMRHGFTKPDGLTSWSESANLFASSPLNLSGFPTLAKLIPANPAPAASDFASFDKTWEGTWTCPASVTMDIERCDLPGQPANCQRRVISYTFAIERQLTMWCVPDGVALPTRAVYTPHPTDPIWQPGSFKCPADTFSDLTGWCLSHTLGRLTVPTRQATYTPPPDAPVFLETANGTLVCPARPGDYRMYLKGQWCLRPGMEMPSLAVNNLCRGINGNFSQGWCLRNHSVSGQDYGMVRPVDPSGPQFPDAADPEIYQSGDFNYNCPASTYNPAGVVSLTAFGAPKAPWNRTSPCYGEAKALAGASYCRDSVTRARAEASYNSCLAANSLEPYKTIYAKRATEAEDHANWAAQLCPWDQVRRDGVCVKISATTSPPPGPADSVGKCAEQYAGPNDDPQFDSYCKIAAFDACLHRTANITAYDQEGRAACATLDKLLRATNGPKDYCSKYCPYPY